MNPWPYKKPSKPPIRGRCERCKVNNAETRVDLRPEYDRVLTLCSGCMLKAVSWWARKCHKDEQSRFSP